MCIKRFLMNKIEGLKIVNLIFVSIYPVLLILCLVFLGGIHV